MILLTVRRAPVEITEEAINDHLGQYFLSSKLTWDKIPLSLQVEFLNSCQRGVEDDNYDAADAIADAFQEHFNALKTVAKEL